MGGLVLVNKKIAKKNVAIKNAQKKAKKYYKEKIFSCKKDEPKAKIRKIVDITDIEFREYESIPSVHMGKNKFAGANRETLLQLCEKHKLTGRSGNGFLVERKLQNIRAGAILLINAVECDPGLAHDAWIYRNRLKDVEESIKLLDAICGFGRIILATKEPLNKEFPYEQVKVNDRFPFGYEKILTKKILGVDLADEEYPSDKNILVMNLQTILVLGEIVHNEVLADYKYITVSDLTNAKAFVTRVKIGEPVCDVIARFFPNKTEGEIYCGGGAFFAHPVRNGEVVVDTTSAIFISEKVGYSNEKRCIGCGACVKNCPAGVNVKALIAMTEKEMVYSDKKLEKCKIEQCIGCGACTYVCVTGKDTREVVRCLKQELLH